LCNAHLLRELIFLYEVQDQQWADQLIDCLLDMKDTVEEAKNKNTSNCGKQGEKLKTRYDEIVRQGFDANPLPDEKEPRKKGRPKRTVAQNLLFRLRDYKNDILAFVDDFDVPFDNNLPERDIFG
jgi:transposase